ncbi:MAG: glycosyltransferase family 1 protein [Candidatus Sumerlaeia bacterium]|nr:glycosyltransferase family 1 protein [Candidatus Sumerlaeia bacterium]
MSRTRAHLVVDARQLLPRSTGVGHYIRGILSGLDEVAAEAGMRVSVLYYPSRNEELERFWRGLKWCRPHAVRVHPESHPASDIWQNSGLSGWMQQLRGTHLFSPAFVGPLIKWGTFRTIVCLHDALVWDYPENYPRGFGMYLRTFARLSAWAAWRTVCPSPGAREQLLGHGVADPLIVPYGLDHGIFHPGITTTTLRPIPQSAPIRIAFLASFERRKNHELLFEALRIAERNGRKFHLLLVHNATKQEERSLLPKAEGLSIELVRPVHQGEIADVFRECHFSVLPSLSEGFGAPALESMACGCPVILSATNWFRYLSANGERAWLADPYDPEKWAETIEALLQNPAQTKEKTEQALKFSREFTWANSARELMRICLSSSAIR